MLFRGSVPMASTAAGIVSLNVLAKDSILRYYYNTETPDFKQSLVSAAVAGIGIAPIISLQEFAVTLQQKVPVNVKAQNSFFTLYNFFKKHGAARGFIGMPATAVRNTFISASFLSFTPYLKKRLQPAIKNDFLASIFAGIMIGVFTSVFVYPLDTLKTNQQAKADGASVRHLALRRLAKEVIQTRGVRGLYAGSPWYFVGLSSYITILAYLNEKLPKAYKNHPLKRDGSLETNQEEKLPEKVEEKKPRGRFSFFGHSKTVKEPTPTESTEIKGPDAKGRGAKK